VVNVLLVGAHQDDIELHMIAAVRGLLRNGHTVHTLTLTTGENSGARASYPDLSAGQFTTARDDEAMRAARRWGARFGNIHTGWVDGSDRPADSALPVDDPARPLTPQVAADMIAGYLAELGEDAWVKTHSNRSWTGGHPDHIAAGRGATLLLQAGVIVANGLRCYAPPYQFDAFQQANPGLSVGVEHAASNDVAILQAALDQYTWADGVGGYYGIGQASVASALSLVRSQLASYWHLP
jgi:LmbE family N-acetylglucosaminyl deacetylase